MEPIDLTKIIQRVHTYFGKEFLTIHQEKPSYAHHITGSSVLQDKHGGLLLLHRIVIEG